MSVVRGATVIALAVRTAWSREESEFVSKSSRPKTVAGASVAATTWTAAHFCAYTQVRCRRSVTVQSVSSVCEFNKMCAGVVLQRVQSPVEQLAPKLMRSDLPSDDEVEVVTEWLAPPVLEVRSNLLETPPSVSPPTSPPLHVPVIQRPGDTTSTTPQDRDKVCVRESSSPSAGTTETDFYVRLVSWTALDSLFIFQLNLIPISCRRWNDWTMFTWQVTISCRRGGDEQAEEFEENGGVRRSLLSRRHQRGKREPLH